MKILAGLLALFALSAAMSMPETGTTPPNAGPFDTVRAVALNWAAAEFPGAKLGAAIPYVDENGNTVAWMFHFHGDGKSFPGYKQVAADAQAERKTLSPPSRPFSLALQLQPHPGIGAPGPGSGHLLRLRHFCLLCDRGEGVRGARRADAGARRQAVAHLLREPPVPPLWRSRTRPASAW